LALTDALVRRFTDRLGDDSSSERPIFSHASAGILEATTQLSLYSRYGAVASLGTRLEHLSRLEEGWDSYDAQPVSRALLNRVGSFVIHLLDQAVPLPELVPTSSGTVIVSWRREDLEIEIDLHPEGEDLEFVRSQHASFDYEGSLELISGEAKLLLERSRTRLTEVSNTLRP
jgi:hypothetical protein